MMDKFIGCMVSLDCGDILGTYQGQVIAINPVEGTLTVVQPYRNGVPFKSPQVTLRSQDIKNLTIVKSSDEVKQLPPSAVNKQLFTHPANSKTVPANSSSKAPTASTSIESTSFGPNENGPNNLFAKTKTFAKGVPHASAFDSLGGPFVKSGQRFDLLAAGKNFSSTFQGSSNDALSDGLANCLNELGIISRSEICQSVSDSAQNGSNSRPHVASSASFASLNGFLNATDDHLNTRKRTISASEGPSAALKNGRKSQTPRKWDRNAQQNKINEDCFNSCDDAYDDDFDFEKNLALFDKHAVFEAIEKETGTAPVKNAAAAQAGRCSSSKYRCDENVLQGMKAAPALHQIRLPKNGSVVGKDFVAKEYRTDSGLVVPSIPPELKEQLFGLAEKHGFSRERKLEMMGRSAGEMILQLVGGNNRFDLKNSHQRPTVVVLCGSGLRAAIGLNCARHLAGHSVMVTVFLPRSLSVSKEMEPELQLFKLTSGKIISNCAELPHSAVDMIVTAIDSTTDGCDGVIVDASGISWHEAVVEWANENKARVLALDPPTEGGPVNSTWCLAAGLPLSYADSCGQVYLCDLSIPQKVYKDVGIVYRSPFAHKFVVPLHSS